MPDTLEQKTRQETRICGFCGNSYDLRARQQETKKVSKPNTADDYCCDNHWASETGIYEG